MFIKVCGVTSEEDALLAVAMGATALGFNFAPGSPRRIAPSVAADIVKRLDPGVLSFGVFRDEAPQRVSDIAVAAGLGGVQLHGHEPPEVARWLRTRVPFVVQAFTAGDARVARAGEYGVDAVLLDSDHPGSGSLFDWSLGADVPTGIRVIVAGGLDPANVGSAIEHLRPWGVDVASGVESSPGRKDPIKLRDFVAAALAAFDSIAPEPGGDGAGELYDWGEQG